MQPAQRFRRQPASGPLFGLRARALRLACCAALAAGLLPGCGRDGPAAALPAGTASAAAQAAAVLPDEAADAAEAAEAAALVLPDVMEWVVEPAAAVVAAAADQHGWAGLAPRSDEAWQAVVDAAAELLRVGDMLAAPALARGQAEWLQSAAALREGAQTAAAAARRRDPRGLYLAGVQLKSSCLACHARLAAPLALPPAAGPPPRQ